MSEEYPVLRRRAVRPRAAATLILVSYEGCQPRILMGRRNTGHLFMPGKWVFPGGQIARADYTAPAASEPGVGIACEITREFPWRRLRALTVTAVRETFEETGLILAAQAQAQPPNRGAWRDFCIGGVAPDLAAMSLIGRMITPPHRPKRFDTLFFVADAARLVSRQPVDTRELEELDWLMMADAARLDLARPTRMILEELHLRLAGEQRPLFFRRFRNARE